MTDKEKLEKIVAYLMRRMYAHNQMADIGSTGEVFDEKIENAKYEECKDTLNFIDSMQEEPARIKKGCKYRCLSDMQNTDTGAISFFKDKIYSAPKDDTLVSEENGWLCDISENYSNFELVEEPKKCMYSKDNYTDEDRKVLCDGCKEDCKYARLVWHDATEEPKYKAECLVVSKRGSKEVATYGNGFFHKGHVVCEPCRLYALGDIEKWIYIEDIIK